MLPSCQRSGSIFVSSQYDKETLCKRSCLGARVWSRHRSSLSRAQQPRPLPAGELTLQLLLFPDSRRADPQLLLFPDSRRADPTAVAVPRLQASWPTAVAPRPEEVNLATGEKNERSCPLSGGKLTCSCCSSGYRWATPQTAGALERLAYLAMCELN
jgi:hypothetical protein